MPAKAAPEVRRDAAGWAQGSILQELWKPGQYTPGVHTPSGGL